MLNVVDGTDDNRGWNGSEGDGNEGSENKTKSLTMTMETVTLISRGR
jgi:hypothetical protein